MAGPLAGIRIVEFAGLGPAPFAAMMLADHGAEVIRIDRPGATLDPHDPALRSRRSVTLDIKSPEGAAQARALCRTADGLIEGFRPGVMERLGLGPDALLADNPKLVYGRMTGWGQDGPLAQAAGHDINYIAVSGVLHTVGRAGERPVPPLNYAGDFGGGGNLLDGGAHFYDSYETADGQYVAIGAIEPQFYALLLEKLGLADDPDFRSQMDPVAWPGLAERLAALFRTRTRDEWCALLEGSDVCFAPVLSLAEAPRHPHNVARGAFVEVGGMVQPAPAPRFSATPSDPPRPPPAAGADNDLL